MHNQTHTKAPPCWRRAVTISFRCKLNTYSKTSNSLSSSPDLLVINLGEFLLEIITVSLSGVELQRTTGFGTVFDGFVQSLEYGQVGPKIRQFTALAQKRTP